MAARTTKQGILWGGVLILVRGFTREESPPDEPATTGPEPDMQVEETEE